MIIGIITINKSKYVSSIAKKFIRKLNSDTNIVKEINGDLEEVRLTGYNYLIFFIGKTALADKKVIGNLKIFLKGSGTLNNKYASIFIEKKIFGNNKRLLKYSDVLEGAGLMIHFTEIIKSNEQINKILNNFSPIKFGN